MTAALAVNVAPCCDVCGGTPCPWPPFCKTCHDVDQRLADDVGGLLHRRLAAQPTLEENLNNLAARARHLAAEWRTGAAVKIEAVDKAYNFAVALGLAYRAGEDAIQRILVAAFQGPWS